MRTKTNGRSLPKGWQRVKLGEICEINPRRPVLNRADSTLTTFVQMSAVDDLLGVIARPEQRPFSEIKKGYTYFVEDDVIFAKITPCMENGKHAVARNLIDGIGFGSTEFHVIRPNENIIAEWIWRFLRQPSVLQNATNYFTGAVGQQRVPDTFLKSLEIPLPPLGEQQRIASRLNEQLATVESARKAAEEQLQAARQLPSVYLREVFDNGLVHKFPKKTLEDVCSFITDGTHVTPKYVAKGVPFLSVKDVKETGLLFDNCRYISEEEHRELTKRYKPERGDVLYTKVGTTGIAKAVDVDREFSIFVSVALLKLKHEMITPEYLERVLNSPFCRVQAEDLTQGMANRNLVLKDLKRIELPLPPIEEQKQVTKLITEKLLSAKAMINLLESQLAEINRLPASLLREAFAGGV
jgi:type I restriction enzyme S subunit